MNRFLGWSALGVLAICCAGPLQAQERPVQWHIGLGYSMPTGTTADYLENGWQFQGGVTWHPMEDSPLAWQAELFYADHDATHELLKLGQSTVSNVRIDDGSGTVWGLNLNAIYKIPFNEAVGGYFTGGIGIQDRKVSLTQTVLFSGIYCDPWWGYCYSGLVPGQAVVASESTTKFAWNVGFGIEFGESYAGKWFLEAKYNRIETNEPTEFIPLNIGYRF